ncbi:MAG: hypothetical protein NC821_06070, partial [Candidatus Omnitrophica bacterium]|nr:hypothetical protein [Candidatus Omnitrophota bacterium]
LSSRYSSKPSKKEMLIYLDLIKKETINFLNLGRAFYESPAGVLIIQKVESALSSAFKNFLAETL